VPESTIEVLESAPADPSELQALLDAARAADNHQPLAEQKRLQLHGKGPFLALALREPTPDGANQLVGLAQIDVGPEEFGLEVVVHPDWRAAPIDLRRVLVTAARDEVRRRGGGVLRYWVSRAGDEVDADLASLGFSRERELLALRVPLPIKALAGERIEVRPFRPGSDEAAWLTVNARAFAEHPEQGRWDADSLAARQSEPWFDPEGFLIAERDGQLAGSCWTKLHRDVSPTAGEIYVISVNPDFQGKGLGKGLTAAGLDWLARAGAKVGILYVDAANRAAVTMYRSLGFTVDHADRSYLTRVAP
jgi:mycothiol synthase